MKPSPFYQTLTSELTTAPKRIPTRDETPEQDKWDLSILYPGDEAWGAAFASLKGGYERIAGFKGRVGESAQTLLECLEFEKALDIQIERLYHYSMLQVSEDSTNDGNLARHGQLQNLLTRIGEASSFILPEIQAIDDATFERFLAEPSMAPWRNRLRKARRFKPHTLSPAEERLLALGAAALYGHKETFSQLTNVDMRFGLLRDEDGQDKELTQSSFSSFLVRRDADVRKAAFHQFYREFADHQYTLAAALSSSIKTDVFRSRARNYASALEASLFPDRIPVAVYDNLISTVRAHLKPLHDYYELRRRVLGLDQIHHHDTYVPMVPEIEAHTTFDEALAKVLGALAPLGSEYVEALAAGFRKRWCDRYETKGKRSGAFSSSSYGNPPYILMNYKEDVFADTYTLAHEAGHSMHSWFAQSHQSFQDYDYPIFLAEVASTFNEELLTHALLEQAKDRKMRAYLINRQIDDIRGTLYRQTMFAEFEKIAHEMEERGEALTLDSFRRAYRELLNVYFGGRFAIDQELELECLRIPHFYSDFYVYKYATGMSAAVALSQKVLNGGPADVGAYLKFLKSGGSEYPIETLQAAGVDMSTPAPIEATLELFARRVGQLEELLAP